MGGGTPGSLKGLKSFWDPVGFTSKMSPEKLERQRLSELKNGRLAMLGITSVLIPTPSPAPSRCRLTSRMPPHSSCPLDEPTTVCFFRREGKHVVLWRRGQAA